MAKESLSKEESGTIAENVLVHCFGGTNRISQDMIERVTVVVQKSLETIVSRRRKSFDTYPYLLEEEQLRKVFEEQHQGRDLERNRFGNYRKPQIAALWNQHIKTARSVEKLLRELLNHD